MSVQLAALPITNATVLCIGGITQSETENGRADGYPIDGNGYYLFLASENEPNRPIQLLAKFLSPTEAEMCAKAFGAKGAQISN